MRSAQPVRLTADRPLDPPNALVPWIQKVTPGFRNRHPSNEGHYCDERYDQRLVVRRAHAFLEGGSQRPVGGGGEIGLKKRRHSLGGVHRKGTAKERLSKNLRGILRVSDRRASATLGLLCVFRNSSSFVGPAVGLGPMR